MKVVTRKGFRDYHWGSTFRHVGDEFEVDPIRGNNLKKSGFVDIIPETKPMIKEEEAPIKKKRGPNKKKEEKTERETKEFKNQHETK